MSVARSRYAVLMALAAVPFLAAACGGDSGTDSPVEPTAVTDDPASGAPFRPTTLETSPTSIPVTPEDVASLAPTPTEESSVVTSPAPIPAATPTPTEEEAVELARSRFPSYWETDFSKSKVPFLEIRGGGPSRIDIPPVSNNRFETVEEADEWLLDLEPMFVVQIGDDVRAYSQSIFVFVLTEVLNDVVGGKPIAVTW